MKLITINVTDEEHKAIKLRATEAGVSIKDFLLGSGSTGLAHPLSTKAKQNPASAAELCKHGFPPAFCKFSKPGKACK
jgi:hypothetical protein